ncbi:MAG: 16S rRNA (guanine(527)-N(7))-methyltransferase RsmG [Myxococcota bacterium]|jgi:16S rRNA (guanine527-N7)-methyltransferase|nr:16S rRNA (guanine(527)-N(7))-methyltransferase RsmG [Myxococcota bacterium]
MDHNERDGQESAQDRAETRGTIMRGLEALRRAPHRDHVEQLVDLATLLADWAPRMNLTAHRGPVAIAQRLILDAIALFEVLPSFTRIVDLGSGAGFPYLPVAILHPEREFTSVEARSRRVSFQKTVVRNLGLENVDVLLGRIESLEPRLGDAAIAQALAEPERARDYLLPWVEPGGWLAIPGTPDSLATPPPTTEGLESFQVRDYRVPETEIPRKVWIAHRTT